MLLLFCFSSPRPQCLLFPVVLQKREKSLRRKFSELFLLNLSSIFPKAKIKETVQRSDPLRVVKEGEKHLFLYLHCPSLFFANKRTSPFLFISAPFLNNLVYPFIMSGTARTKELCTLLARDAKRVARIWIKEQQQRNTNTATKRPPLTNRYLSPSSNNNSNNNGAVGGQPPDVSSSWTLEQYNESEACESLASLVVTLSDGLWVGLTLERLAILRTCATFAWCRSAANVPVWVSTHSFDQNHARLGSRTTQNKSVLSLCAESEMFTGSAAIAAQ